MKKFFLISGCLIVAAYFSYYGFPQAKPVRHFVSAATIFDENMIQIKSFPGLGVFFDDGSYILAIDGPKWVVVKYSPIGDVIWEREFYTHHQLNLSNDKKRLLVMSGEVRKVAEGTRNYDLFVVLDVETGKTLLQKSAYDFTAGSKFFSINRMFPDSTYLATGGAMTHFNSFYEIPENAAAKFRPEFKKGNYIVNDALRACLLILDENLNLIYEEELFPDNESMHDVQVLPDGKVLLYRGKNKIAGLIRTIIYKYDPLTKKTEVVFPENILKPEVPAYIGFSESKGSVEVTEEGYLISHNDSVHGGMIILTDKAGRLLKKMPYPEIDKATGKPAGIQQIKQFHLTEFLENNKI